MIKQEIRKPKVQKDTNQSELSCLVQLNSLDWQYTEAQNTFMLNLLMMKTCNSMFSFIS